MNLFDFNLYGDPSLSLSPPRIKIISPTNGAVITRGSWMGLNINVSSDYKINYMQIEINGQETMSLSFLENTFHYNNIIWLDTQARAFNDPWHLEENHIKITVCSGGQCTHSETVIYLQPSGDNPNINIILPTNNSLILQGNVINIETNITDDQGLSWAELYLDSTLIESRSLNGEYSTIYSTQLNTSSWSLGNHELKIAVYDIDGNFNETQVQITIKKLEQDIVHGVFRNGTWILKTSNGRFSLSFGKNGDIPIIGDFDHDGVPEIGIFRSGIWIVGSSTNGRRYFGYGKSGDQPVVGDFGGDGKLDYGVFRAGTWIIKLSDGTRWQFTWGREQDIPIVADFDSDGVSDPGVFRDGLG